MFDKLKCLLSKMYIKIPDFFLFFSWYECKILQIVSNILDVELVLFDVVQGQLCAKAVQL